MFQRHGWIGIDAGASAVRIAQVRRQGSEFVLGSTALIRRNSPWTALGGAEASARTSSEELRAAKLSSESLRGRLSAAVLPIDACTLRTVRDPAVAGLPQRSDVARALETTYSVPLARRQFDFWPIPAAGQAKETPDNCYVITTSPGFAHSLARDLRRAGLQCQLLDGLPTALSRASLLDSPPQRGPHAFVDWGYSRVTFGVVVDGCPAYVRTLRETAMTDVLEAVCDSIAVDRLEADQLLASVRLGDPPQGDLEDVSLLLSDLVEPVIARVADELARTLEFLKKQYRSLVPGRLLLFGGGATIGGIDRWLAARLEVDCQVWTPRLVQTGTAAAAPLALFGPAIALSMLAWEKT